MTLEELKKSIGEENQPAQGLEKALQALWHDKKGNWNKAHQIAQDVADAEGSWVHAYLHRKEGDLGNARYWYGRAGRTESMQNLDQEWDEIARHLLAKV